MYFVYKVVNKQSTIPCITLLNIHNYSSLLSIHVL